VDGLGRPVDRRALSDFVSLDSDPPDITAGNVCPDV
jgi:hypothetical protein